MEAAIHIGNTQTKKSIKQTQKAIIEILEARADQETIRKALDAFTHVAEVKNVSISGCHVDCGDKHYHQNNEEENLDDEYEY